MVSVAVRRRSIAHKWTLVLGVVAAAHSVLAQTNAPVTDDARAQLADTIARAQAQDGPYSRELIDPLRSLSLLYEETGQHDLAAAVIEQALQVIKANYGLRTLEQVPLIKQRIVSEETRGNFAAAWDLEQALLRLARANPDDSRARTVFHEIGDKRIDLLESYLGGEAPPQVIIGCFYEGWQRSAGSGCSSSGTRSFAAQMILAAAQSNYLQAIRSLVREGLYSSEELRELELDLARSSYVYGGYVDGGRYQTGRSALSRLMTYSAATGEPILSRATALVQVADWDLVFEHRDLALDTYEETYEFLQQQGVAQASIDELFSPETPVVLPAFLPNPLVAEEKSAEHIDVAFEVTLFGFSRRIEVLGATDTVSKADKDDLVHLIQRSRFRPRVVNGELARASRVVVRYYL